jgi:UDP-N-acetylmuramyl tripeptide synthase
VQGLPPDSRVVVNGDDPQLGELARGREGALVFGLDDPGVARRALPHAADSKHCVRCGTPYEFSASYVGHLGDYRCPSCGHARPPLDVRGREIRLHGLEGVSFRLHTPAGEVEIGLQLPGLYNVYNAVAAASLTLVAGASLDEIRRGLESFSPAFGRFERIAIGERTLLLLLIKNPAGANEVVRTLVDGGVPPLLVLALNDGIADGRDTSWIWDVDMGALRGRPVVAATGERAADVALRLTVAGIDPVLEPRLEHALLRAVDQGGAMDLLADYTSFQAARRLVGNV